MAAQAADALRVVDPRHAAPAAITAAGLDYLAFGHFGDCHLHFTILPERLLNRGNAVEG